MRPSTTSLQGPDYHESKQKEHADQSVNKLDTNSHPCDRDEFYVNYLVQSYTWKHFGGCKTQHLK